MTNFKEWGKMIRQLKELLEVLPSQEEREEVVSAIKEIMTILSQIGDSLSSLPTREEAAKAREGLERLEFVLERNPLLRSVSFKEVKPKPVPKASQPTEIPQESVLREVEELTQLPEEQLQMRLSQDERYSKRFLLSILSALGRQVSSKATKKEIIDQIVVTIVNRRTYEGLRKGGGGDN